MLTILLNRFINQYAKRDSTNDFVEEFLITWFPSRLESLNNRIEKYNCCYKRMKSAFLCMFVKYLEISIQVRFRFKSDFFFELITAISIAGMKLEFKKSQNLGFFTFFFQIMFLHIREKTQM